MIKKLCMNARRANKEKIAKKKYSYNNNKRDVQE